MYDDLTVMPDELKSAATNSAAHAGIWRQEEGLFHVLYRVYSPGTTAWTEFSR